MTKTKVTDHPIARLSFVVSRRGQKGRCFWSVAATGDYSHDCKIGEGLALEYLAYEEADEDGPGHLPQIVADMPRTLTGVEVGFLSIVAYAAGAGAWRARQIADYWRKAEAQRAAQKPRRAA